MSVRTCQLCGKPLSRILSGGGDFCSREHRNQYRLRCGMDRLMEADKLASMMRRRDHLKQFPNSVLLAQVPLAPREYPAAPIAAERPVLSSRAPVTDMVKRRIECATGFIARRVACGMAATEVQRTGPRARFVFPGRLFLAAARARRLPVSMPRAGSVPENPRAAENARLRQRAFDILTRLVRGAHLAGAFPNRGLKLRTGLERQKFRRIPPAAKLGNAFRVSSAAAFRVPRQAARGTALPPPRIDGMIWPKSRRLSLTAHSNSLAAMTAGGPAFPAPGTQPGRRRQRVGKSGMPGAGTVAVKFRPRRQAPGPARPLPVAFCLAQNELAKSRPRFRLDRGERSARYAAVSPLRAGVGPTHRTSVAPILPQDSVWIRPTSPASPGRQDYKR
jgi:hypothetical protein